MDCSDSYRTMEMHLTGFTVEYHMKNKSEENYNGR